ncbi:T-complex protein 1 subunit gamma [Anopheles arabiensis]|uniref:T-complex protein 1 subunit gamma n=5 Tax=gambiae species complex TaxID=44542 RepID=Q7QCQ5_ANOGA|nr:T-complex protein 1 subunit gamma [Anopheles arabiensis]XP_040229161.1 T-complex protein 1 subunit gamma [Anopheles coluzzii]XP_041761161.1 T-complex protein 1 subunit gamma-like [Anopheles merus]XP_041787881.1 T-complex protein 1 subunit gamma-like [Anopheles merus]XP_312164.4 T-complex protein 1 subunit gamma [Anopheles gambiae]EAA07808.4 AGAP002759-PA [Anopheles gambiae str. PEST]
MYAPQQPILILSKNTKRESGRKVQLENINAGKTIADLIRTCLGPQAMMKMLMDPMGGIVMTNDGNAILREITVQHPAAKSMIEIARTQDEEVGDGTTSVIVLAGEMLAVAEQFLQQQIHPTVIIRAYREALEDMVRILQDEVSIELDRSDKKRLAEVVKSCVGTKFVGRWSDLAVRIALDAVETVSLTENGRTEIDIKKYAKVEKIPGGSIDDSCVLRGIMLNKDVTHPKMRRYIEKPRIVLLDCPLEYKKGESQTNVEIVGDQDFTKLLQIEEEHVARLCEDIIAVKPDVVFTEKGVSDLAQHFLMKAGITAIRRLRKTDNNRLARACGATIVNRTEELTEKDVGTGAGLFEIKKMGDEYFCFVTECEDPKACTILLRGASKDVLNETERNLQDALHVARNLMLDPKLLPGGGAVEMAVSQALTNKQIQGPYRAVAQALEIIPRTLAQNCGANTIRTLTALRAKHASHPAADGPCTWGIDGETGQLVDMKEKNIWEPLSVKLQVYKTAVETAILLLRIDDIVSGSKKRGDDGSGPSPAAAAAGMGE